MSCTEKSNAPPGPKRIDGTPACPRTAASVQKLAPVIRMPANELLAKLSDRTKGFVYLKRKMDLDIGQAVDKPHHPDGGQGQHEERRPPGFEQRRRYTGDQNPAARADEQRAMLDYAGTGECRMDFLRRRLDDPTIVRQRRPRDEPRQPPRRALPARVVEVTAQHRQQRAQQKHGL